MIGERISVHLLMSDLDCERFLTLLSDRLEALSDLGLQPRKIAALYLQASDLSTNAEGYTSMHLRSPGGWYTPSTSMTCSSPGWTGVTGTTGS